MQEGRMKRQFFLWLIASVVLFKVNFIYVEMLDESLANQICKANLEVLSHET